MEKLFGSTDSGDLPGDGIPEAANEEPIFAEGVSGPSTKTFGEAPATAGLEEGLDPGEAVQGTENDPKEGEDEGGGAEQLAQVPAGDEAFEMKTALEEEGEEAEPSNLPELTAESLQGVSLKELRVRCQGLGKKGIPEDIYVHGFLCMVWGYDELSF